MINPFIKIENTTVAMYKGEIVSEPRVNTTYVRLDDIRSFDRLYVYLYDGREIMMDTSSYKNLVTAVAWYNENAY